MAYSGEGQQGTGGDLELRFVNDHADDSVGASQDGFTVQQLAETAHRGSRFGAVASPRQSPLLTTSVEQNAETEVCPDPGTFRCVQAAQVVVRKKSALHVVVAMNIVMAVTQMMKHKCWVDHTQPLTSIAETFGALGGFAIVGCMPVLRDATGPDGAMKTLGAGGGGLVIKAIGGSTRISLRWWDTGLFVCMVGMFIFGTLWLSAISPAEYGNLATAVPAGDVLTIIFCLAGYAWWCVAVPLLLACFLVMKICARLAQCRIVTVRRSAALFTPGTEQWETHVVVATRELINSVLFSLSSTFGNFVVSFCIFCWSLALYHLCYGILARAQPGYGWITSFTLCFSFVCAPLLVFYDLAMGGTECDNLVAVLNGAATDTNHMPVAAG